MDQLSKNPEERVKLYLNGKRQIKERRLGSGTDGEVFIVTEPQAAIKVHYDQHRYLRELHAYQRLVELNLDRIGGFAIPTLHGHDNHLLIIEMSIVRPPFLIDFGKATVDDDQGWSQDLIDAWWENVADKFEKDTAIASSIFTQLRDKTGIYQWDLNPANLNFGPMTRNSLD